MKFESKKDGIFLAITSFTALYLLGICIYLFINKEWIVLSIFSILSAYLFWILTAISYKITDCFLHYYVGPHQGKIPMQDIREIIVGETMWSGLKPATARKGLIIKYEKYNEIYISPRSNEQFILEILRINRAIKITYSKP